MNHRKPCVDRGKPNAQRDTQKVRASPLLEDVRPAKFSSMKDVVAYYKDSMTARYIVKSAEKMGLDPNDIVVNIQGDQPEVHPQHLLDVVRPFQTDPDVEMSTLAFKIVKKDEITDPKDCKVTFDSRGYALYFSRSAIPCARDADTIFDTYKHLGIYAYTRRFLETFRNLPEGRLEAIEKLEQLRAIEYGYNIRVIITEHDSPEVDLPEDISIIEGLDEQR